MEKTIDLNRFEATYNLFSINIHSFFCGSIMIVDFGVCNNVQNIFLKSMIWNIYDLQAFLRRSNIWPHYFFYFTQKLLCIMVPRMSQKSLLWFDEGQCLYRELPTLIYSPFPEILRAFEIRMRSLLHFYGIHAIRFSYKSINRIK